MKRTIKLTALVLAIALCTAIFTSCGASAYKKNLEKAGYSTEQLDKDAIKRYNAAFESRGIDYNFKSILVAEGSGGEFALVIQLANADQAKRYADEQGIFACDIAYYESKLKKAGYQTQLAEKSDIAESNEELKVMGHDITITSAIMLTNGSGEDYVTVYQLASPKDAESFSKELEAVAEVSAYTVELIGNTVILGTATALRGLSRAMDGAVKVDGRYAIVGTSAAVDAATG